MLSKHERDRLAEIESELVSANPELAEKFERFEHDPGWGVLRRVLIYTVLTLTAMLALISLASGLVWTAAALGGIAVAGTGAAALAAHGDDET